MPLCSMASLIKIADGSPSVRYLELVMKCRNCKLTILIRRLIEGVYDWGYASGENARTFQVRLRSGSFF